MDGHASGWYDRTVRRAMSRAKKVFPELKKKENQAVFKAILAITSNGQKVMPQFARSYELFDKWLAGGRGSMPSNGTWGGERAGAMAAHFEALSLLFTLYGLKGTQQFLDSKFTVGQLNKFGNEVLGLPEGKKIISSEAVDTVVQGSMIFGAKLGNFYANMSGDFSAVTMDLWFMRSLGRIIGDIDRADPEKRAGHKKVLVDAMRAEGIPAPRDPAKFDEKARAMLKARNARYTAARGTDVTIESTPLERAVKLYVDGGKLKETPGSGYERRELRILVGMAQEKLRAAGIFLDNADFQAILWYYEKDLVEALGGKKRGKDADYAEAASILEQKFQRSSEYRSDGARSAGGAGRLRPGHFARFSLSSEEAGRVSELGMPLSEEPAGSFAMGSADYLERVATDLAGRRKNPEQRRAAWNRSKRALEDLVLSLDGREDPRIALSRAAISKERKKLQGKLEDDYVEEVWRFYGGALSMTDDLTKATGYPIIAHLMKKAAGLPQGRLMAESKAKKLGDYSKANYDSSRDLPSWLFKGEIAPDQMAQEMHADGLIKEPDVDLMFWSIQEALDSARRSKLQYEEAWAELQSAKRRAKTEALAWEDKAIRALGRDGAKAGAAVVRDAVRGLAAAMVGLPAEVRGKVGGFSRMAGLTTDKAREKFLLETVAKADQALERFMQDEYALQIRKVLEKGMAENKGGEKPKGKIGVEGSRLFAKIAKVVDLSPDEISAAMGNFDKLELDLLGDDSISEEDRRSALADIFDDRRVFDTYGGLFYSDRDGFLRSAAEMDVALTDISEAYTTGRNKWMAVEQARLDDVHEKQDAVVEALGKTSFMGRKRKDQVQKQRLAFLSTLRYSGVSWAQMLDALLGSKHPLAIRWSRKVGEAMGRKTDKLIEQRSRLEQAMKNAMGPGTNSLQAAQRMFDMQTLESINVRKREGSGKSSELVTRKLKESRDRIQSAMDGTLDPAALGVSQAEFELFKAEEERLFMKGSKAKQVTIEVTEEGEVDGTATLTEAQAISLTMLARQEQYKRNLDKWGWDQDAIDDAEAGLSDEGRILRAWLSREYAENYEPLAAVFRRMNGTDLPQILNYSPVQSYHDGIQIEMDAMGGGMMPEGGLRASMLKSRKKHSAELKINSAFSVYYQHVNQSEHFIAFAELTRELRGVFSSQVVQKAVEARLGKEANRKLLAWIDAIQQNGRTNPDKGDAVHKLLGFFQGRVAKIALGAKIGTLLVQSTAAFASVARIGPTAFMRGLAAAMKEPSTFKDFWSSPMIQRRVLAGASPLQRQAMEEHFNARPTRPMVWVEKALELIGTVDGLFTTISGVAAYQYHLDQNLASGMDYDQARRAAMLEAEDVVRRTAQPVELTDKSLIEVDANPIVRFAMLFGSESRKNLALVTEAISQYREGRITAAEMNRALLFVGVISGGLSYLIRSAWWDARDDDDDEIFDDKHWSAMGLMMSMMTAPAQGIPLVRDAISGFSDRGDLEGVMRGIDAAKKLSRAVKEKDLTDQPVEFVEKQIVSILNGAGMLNDRAVPLAVAANLFDQVFKVGDNLFDDSEEAAKKERAAERKEKKEAKEAKE